MTDIHNTENRNNRTHPPKRLGLYLMIPLIMGFFVICVLAGEWRTSLRVENIEIDGAHILPHHLLLAAVKVPTQSLLDTVDLYYIQKRLEEQPFIRSARVNRSYPDAIRVEITEREPVACIGIPGLHFLDAEAVLLPPVETAVPLDLPFISGIYGLKGAKTGSVLNNDEVHAAIDLLRTAIEVDSSLYHFISEVNMQNGGDIQLTTTDPAVSIIVGREDIMKKLLVFQAFWGQFVKSEDVQKVQHFDLRFDDRVIVKWNSDHNKQ